MDKETCGTCRFWSKIEWPDKRINDEGHCCRYPPQVYGMPAKLPDDDKDYPGCKLHANRPPITISVNWCGEWQEAKKTENGIPAQQIDPKDHLGLFVSTKFGAIEVHKGMPKDQMFDVLNWAFKEISRLRSELLKNV